MENKPTLKDIENAINELYKTNSKFADNFVRKLTPEEVSGVRGTFGFLTESMGTELYRLPGGVITGPGGLKLFNEAMQKLLRI